MVSFRMEIPVYKLSQDVAVAHKAYEQSLALKQELEKTQAKLDAMQVYRQTTKTMMDITLNQYEEILKEFQTSITRTLYTEFHKFENLDEREFKALKELYNIDPNLTPSESRTVLADLVTESLKLVLRRAFKIEYHM
jgi:hypothetical protein